MREILPHIKIGSLELGGVALIIDDFELFDFIEDYLIEECDIEYTWRSSVNRIGGEIITLYFSNPTTSEQLESVLLKLSSKEIEAIYRLNNDTQ
ncbi:MAG: hypothetical protein JSR34_06710 [Proteobacteria bacterium]|nr:hypothetical protein [Pseudomonadota bacterium]